MIGIGVLGCGYWGSKVIRSLSATPGCRMIAACDPRRGRRDYIRERYPWVTVLNGADELIDRSDVQAIWLATPVATHHALARGAIEHGKHVLVEKPLATTVIEAEDLVELAQSRGLTIHAGHTYLFSPAVDHLRKLLARGIHGETCYVTSERINPGPPETDVDVLWDLAVHDVAIVLDLVGRRPVNVSACGDAYLRAETPDVSFITMKFSGGVKAVCHVSWLSAAKTRVMKLYGTRATLIYDDLAESPVRVVGPAEDSRRDSRGEEAIELSYGPGRIEEYRPEGVEPLVAECTAFLNSIRFSTASPNSGRRALEVVRVLEAAQTSLMEGGMPVEMPLDDARSAAVEAAQAATYHRLPAKRIERTRDQEATDA